MAELAARTGHGHPSSSDVESRAALDLLGVVTTPDLLAGQLNFGSPPGSISVSTTSPALSFVIDTTHGG